MKYQFSICAKRLPSEGLYKAVLTVSGDASAVVGQTEVSPTSTDPQWNSLVVTEEGALADDAAVDVLVKNAEDDAVIASATFAVSELLGAGTNAVSKFSVQDGDGGALIAVHASEAKDNGKVEIVLGGRDLPDTDFGLSFFSKKEQHSDPYYEVMAARTFKKLGESNVVEDNLNPLWDAQTFPLDALCDNDLNASFLIMVYDKDAGDANTLLGRANVSVQQLMDAAQSGSTIPLTRGPNPKNPGCLVVETAKLQPQELVSRDAIKALEAASGTLLRGLDEAQAFAETKAAEAAQAAEAASAAEAEAAKTNAAVEGAAKALETARQEYEVLAAKAMADAELAKISPVQGKLKLTLRAKGLPDMDFGFANKTDAIFEVYKIDSDDRIHRSNIVENELNPTWNPSYIDLVELCGGQLDAPFNITISDKDGGDKKNYIGMIKKSVNQLLLTPPEEAIPIENQVKGNPAHLYVVEAVLEDMQNLKEVAATSLAACDPAKAALENVVAAYKKAEQAANEARQAAAIAREAADKAQDEAEAAQLALKAMQ